MKKYILSLILSLIVFSGYSQTLVATSESMHIYKGDSLQASYEVPVVFYITKSDILVNIGTQEGTFKVLDIHYSEDKTEVHFATKGQDGSYVEEVIYLSSSNAIVMVDYLSGVTIVFPDIYTEMLEGQGI